MKRFGRCIGKKAFKYRISAIEHAKRYYLTKGIKLGVYECPTCLDYHTTTKHVNLAHLHKEWEAEPVLKRPKTRKYHRYRRHRAIRVEATREKQAALIKQFRVWAQEIQSGNYKQTHRQST